MRCHKQRCWWKSGIRRSRLRFYSFLKKTLIISNDCAAFQACSFGKNHLTSNYVRFVLVVRSILDSSLDPRLRFSFI